MHEGYKERPIKSVPGHWSLSVLSIILGLKKGQALAIQQLPHHMWQYYGSYLGYTMDQSRAWTVSEPWQAADSATLTILGHTLLGPTSILEAVCSWATHFPTRPGLVSF